MRGTVARKLRRAAAEAVRLSTQVPKPKFLKVYKDLKWGWKTGVFR